MGHYTYSKKLTKNIDKLEAEMRDIVKELWGDTVVMQRIDGIPIQKGDNRLAKWVFSEVRYIQYDAAFSISLIKDGRAEFKLPITSEGQEMQRALRSRLVRRVTKD